MTSEYIEERNGSYYVARTRILLDSIVNSFDQGASPEAIQKEFPALRLPQVYGAIAFYLDHRVEVSEYLEKEDHRLRAAGTPLSEANPDLWNRLQRVRGQSLKRKS